jgi:glycosyltransferase involved in cell wall biosynthesis
MIAPGMVGGLAYGGMRRRRRPYAVEVAGDPHDALAPGALCHPLRPVLRWLAARQLRRQCAGAVAASYVTRQALQRRYPCGAYSVGVSDVALHDRDFAPAPRPPRRAGPYTLITVGTLAQLYKAPEVLIDAAAACVRGGLDLALVVVGDGRHRPELEARAAALGIGERVRFLGHLPAGAAVRAALDRADVFVLPSRQEGLPRAMVEAMARGLPCIGSTVGGIPELLPVEDLVPPNDCAALARKIREVVTTPSRMARMSTRSLETAGEYREHLLRGRRSSFHAELRRATAAWRAC